MIIEGSFPADSLADLPGLEGLAAERIEGGGLRLTATLSPAAPSQLILGRVFAKDLAIDRFELREPNLHDAFIVLTTRAGAPEAV
jgi:ABC-2 type transport system ATP-binding protein